MQSDAVARMTAACSGAGMPVLRFAASPMWPDTVRESLLRNASAYWALFDEFLADAAGAGCEHLLPIIFASPFAFADALNWEPLGDVMANGSTSSARLAMFGFARDLVARLATSPAVVAFDLFDGLNELADCNMMVHNPYVAPARGTPVQRTLRDNFSTDVMIAFQGDVAATVRAADGLLRRPVSSGHNAPRTIATALRASYHAVPQPPESALPNDTLSQFVDIAAVQSGGMDWLSVHVMGGVGGGDNVRWNVTDPLDTTIITAAAEAARRVQQPLFLGAIGDPNSGNRSYISRVVEVMGAADAQAMVRAAGVLRALFASLHGHAPPSPRMPSLHPPRSARGCGSTTRWARPIPHKSSPLTPP